MMRFKIVRPESYRSVGKALRKWITRIKTTLINFRTTLISILLISWLLRKRDSIKNND